MFNTTTHLRAEAPDRSRTNSASISAARRSMSARARSINCCRATRLRHTHKANMHGKYVMSHCVHNASSSSVTTAKHCVGHVPLTSRERLEPCRIMYKPSCGQHVHRNIKTWTAFGCGRNAAHALPPPVHQQLPGRHSACYGLCSSPARPLVPVPRFISLPTVQRAGAKSPWLVPRSQARPLLCGTEPYANGTIVVPYVVLYMLTEETKRRRHHTNPDQSQSQTPPANPVLQQLHCAWCGGA